ncbi:peptide chain release factor 3 [Draconibacterium sediminis]|uniref:Peptide chain release factor 3 n=1 Tax=Draconibacterium sediminis TaxID=1544798 RepID=A0A0D8J831_9BACT|nr:peptide chain release factor 3 [Draconibacterium sediminis]KJF41948.1 peptide chain release factor 3 [Draconibacterium sediminis]
MSFLKEIQRRRTFGIVSHPDAGKTTLTEKLLLFGGAIRVAGAVKSNKIKKGATSDFMEIERQRGISVATSVMGFEYNGYKVNILDTPGHQDFQEDTFRTLTAVDSVIIVIDAAKGVEPQTEKLMNVCRMRKTPVIVFVNKMDRPAGDPFTLMDEIEDQLKIKVRPLSWPINNGPDFKGVYNIFNRSLKLFTPDIQEIEERIKFEDISDPTLEDHIGEDADVLREELELVEGIYPEFNNEDYLSGELAPVFFGSALYNFGVQELLDSFVKIAPTPQPSETEERVVKPEEEGFTGFVFKIHANIDPNHRSRIAFVKICSGKFERNKMYKNVRLGKSFRISSPTAFMASQKEIVEEAFPGDIIGVPDTGNYIIGDTVTDGEDIHFKGLPSFSPEMFRFVENADPMKSKQLAKGVDQLMDEGVAQLFTSVFNGRKIIGTVGQLQFEVIQYRLEHEYGAKCRFEPLSMHKACWIQCDDEKVLTEFKKRKHQKMAKDKLGRDVFMADSSFILQMAQDEFKDIKFHFTSEF